MMSNKPDASTAPSIDKDAATDVEGKSFTSELYHILEKSLQSKVDVQEKQNITSAESYLHEKQASQRYSTYGNILKVKNIPKHVADEQLKKSFSLFGIVDKALVSMNDEGESTGEGIVDFRNSLSAATALKVLNDGGSLAPSFERISGELSKTELKLDLGVEKELMSFIKQNEEEEVQAALENKKSFETFRSFWTLEEICDEKMESRLEKFENKGTATMKSMERRRFL